MGSALIDRRTARLAVGLAVAGSLMLTAGLGIWAVSALSHAIPHSAHTLAWLAAVALITAGVCCGVLMIVLLLGSGANGRSRAPAEPSWPDARGPRPPRPGQSWPSGPPAGPRPPGPAQPGPVAPPAASWPPPDAGRGPAADRELAAWPDPPAAADHGDRYPAQHWSGPDAQDSPDAGLAADRGWPPTAEPGPGRWPAQDPAPADAGPAAEDADLDDGPAHRVESEFNVWQRPGSAAPPDAGPAAPAQDDWVQPDAGLPDADLLPEGDLRPAAGLRPAVPELLAGPAQPVAEPLDLADSPADDELIQRPPAPRRSGPAPGWNPDSEEDWLRVLRGLRASEDS